MNKDHALLISVLVSALMVIGSVAYFLFDKPGTVSTQGVSSNDQTSSVVGISETLSSADYENDDPPFNMTLPTGFVKVEGVKTPGQFSVAILQLGAVSKYSARIGVRVLDTSDTLDTYHTRAINGYKSYGKVISDKSAIINGVPAYITVSSNNLIGSMTQVSVDMVEKGKLYILIGGSSSEDWDTYKKKFEDSLATFKIR